MAGLMDGVCQEHEITDYHEEKYNRAEASKGCQKVRDQQLRAVEKGNVPFDMEKILFQNIRRTFMVQYR